MMRYIFLLCASVCLLTGCVARRQQTLGHVPRAVVVQAVGDLKPSATLVTVRGTMIEKCPISGCWFRLRDKSGVIKVDTKDAGFVVADVPLNAEMTVSGRLETAPERQIAATGLRY